MRALFLKYEPKSSILPLSQYKRLVSSIIKDLGIEPGAGLQAA